MLTLMTHLDGLPYVLHTFEVLATNEITLMRQGSPHVGSGEIFPHMLND